jgi:hypothetical protein
VRAWGLCFCRKGVQALISHTDSPKFVRCTLATDGSSLVCLVEALHPHPGGGGGQEAEGALVGLRLQCHEAESHLSARNPSAICSVHLYGGVPPDCWALDSSAEHVVGRYSRVQNRQLVRSSQRLLC